MARLLNIAAVLFVTVTLPTGARAFCVQGYGYDFASSVNSSLDYLICLHNEQNDALNSQSRTISENARIFNDAMDRQSQIAWAVDQVSDAIELMISENARLERRVAGLEYRLESLEAQ
jgi:hypothetical protein